LAQALRERRLAKRALDLPATELPADTAAWPGDDPALCGRVEDRVARELGLEAGELFLDFPAKPDMLALDLPLVKRDGSVTQLAGADATVEVSIEYLEGSDGAPREPKTVHFQVGGFWLYSRLIEGNFPNVRSVIPNYTCEGWSFDRKALTEALKTVRQATTDKSRAVRFHIKAGRCELFARTQDVGEARHHVAAGAVDRAHAGWRSRARSRAGRRGAAGRRAASSGRPARWCGRRRRRPAPRASSTPAP